MVCVNPANGGIFSSVDSYGLAPSAVAYDITDIVFRSPLPIRSCELLAGNQDLQWMFLLCNFAEGLELMVNELINLLTRLVIRRHDQRVRRLLDVSFRNRRHAFLTVRDLMDAALLLQVSQGFSNLAACELVHYMFECRISLADDFIQVSGSHPGVLELLER